MQNLGLKNRSMDDEFARNMEDDYTLYNRSRHRFSVNRVSLEHLKHNPFPYTFSRVKGTHPHRYVLSAPTAVPLGELPTSRLCSDTEMLLGCTSRLMHWLMLAANRLGSQARWHLSLREHLPQTDS